MERERSVRLCEYPLARHTLKKLTPFGSAQHRRPNTEPTTNTDGALKFNLRSGKPMQHGNSSICVRFEKIENR